MTIFLVGFMGSGKSTLGKRLAARTGLSVYDTDQEVEKAFRQPISGIFAQYGEDAFREKEAEVLRALPCGGGQGEEPTKGVVVVTGGGLPCHHDNMRWMLQHGMVVWLNTSAEIIFSRLQQDENRCKRPLLKGKDDESLKRFIQEKIKEREPYYRRAHIIFDPETERIEDLINKTK